MNNKREKIIPIIEQWTNKEIVYPTNMILTIQGTDTLFQEQEMSTPYTLISYVDSIGCTSCKLQLPRWKTLIREMDSVSQGRSKMYFILHPKNVDDVIYSLKYNNFKNPVYIDREDSFNKLNHLPSDEAFQTFLLDKDNKVIAIGNPIHNPKVKELYMNIIQGKTATKEENEILTKIQIKEHNISLGRFNWQEEQKAQFMIHNVGKQPLVINDVTTSCGCTSVDYPKQPVRPGDSISLQVTYKAEHLEHFDKTITVYCNANPSLIQLKITGDAE